MAPPPNKVASLYINIMGRATLSPGVYQLSILKSLKGYSLFTTSNYVVLGLMYRVHGLKHAGNTDTIYKSYLKQLPDPPPPLLYSTPPYYILLGLDM
jgi:hypothetical protein